MIEAFRRRMALRDVRASVARRSVRSLPPDPSQRSVLVLLPPDDAALHEAWTFLDQINLPDRLLTLVQTSTEIGYTPDRFAGSVRHITADEHDWRRLPNTNARKSVWTQQPDIGVNLAPPSDLGAALLVGASPAALRIGYHQREHELFYDLMIRAPATGSSISAVERLLRRIDPPIVPFD